MTPDNGARPVRDPIETIDALIGIVRDIVSELGSHVGVDDDSDYGGQTYGIDDRCRAALKDIDKKLVALAMLGWA